MRTSNRIIAIGILLHSLAVNQSQGQVEIGLVITGNTEGEAFKLNSPTFQLEISKEEGVIAENYFSFGDADSVTMRKRIESLEVFVKTVGSSRYKKAKLILPTGLNRYLILRRDRSLRKNRYFSIVWSDKNPFDLHKKDP